MTIKVEGYAYTTHPMPEFMKNLAEEYIEENLGKTIFPYKEHLIDIKTLNNATNLDCMNCHLAHNKLCCEGPPYPPLREDLLKVENQVQNIFSETLNIEKANEKKKLIQNNMGLTDSEGTFIDDCGNCIFFNEIDGSGSMGCSIHNFALKKQQSYLDLKPSSCLMFPMDVLSLDNGGFFIFGIDKKTVVNIYSKEIKGEKVYGVTKDNKGFSRWNQNDLNYLCVNLEERKKQKIPNQNTFYKPVIPNNIYLESSYVPLYKEEKNLLVKLFGSEFYSFVDLKSDDYYQNLVDGSLLVKGNSSI